MQPCCFVEASVLRTLASAICSVEKSQNCKCMQAPRRPCNVIVINIAGFVRACMMNFDQESSGKRATVLYNVLHL